MFTGIVEAVGKVTHLEPKGDGRRITVAAPFAKEVYLDQSIAINGACLTAVAQTATTFSVEAVEETLAKTNLGALQVGQAVNLERALLPQQRLDGHIVQGHVDATGTILGVEQQTLSWLVRIRFDPAFATYVIPKGGIAVEGISLTIADLTEDTFTIAIIPYTYAHTTVQHWKPQAQVNLEFDVLGKYIIRWLEQRHGAVHPTSRLTPDWLREQGF